jgi:hypothetical protein
MRMATSAGTKEDYTAFFANFTQTETDANPGWRRKDPARKRGPGEAYSRQWEVEGLGASGVDEGAGGAGTPLFSL